MIEELCTANYAGGYAFALCGNANRKARGCGCGIYPITPQSEVVETIVNLYDEGKIEKGKIFHVESEHSAMAACIGVSAEGARSFTATSANGALYMAENIISAGLYRFPIVMQIVNRTLGPEWNIWAEQGDSLIFRDWGWMQTYCENNQELIDHIIMAFYISENHKILMPSMVCVDAFILSHTMMPVLLPIQEEVDEYLPLLDLPHRLKNENPFTIGGLVLPRVTASHRNDIENVMDTVFEVYREAQDRFEQIFNYRPEDPATGYYTDDAEIVLVASSTICSTVRTVVDSCRRKGMKVGMVKVKMFRPFPAEQIASLIGDAEKIAVIDRNYSLGGPHKIGGIFAKDIMTSLSLSINHKLIRSFIVGIGGLDVTPYVIEDIVYDIESMKEPGSSIWKGL